MGRAPCCEKVGLKRGRWTSEEDERLTKYIQVNGEGSWKSLPKNAGLLRCGKSCRLRWINYLRGDLKRGNMTLEEDETIVKLQKAYGNRWSKIASHLPGRTDNEIKNYWNSHLSRQIYRFFTSKKDETQSIVIPTMVTRKKQSVGRVSRSVAKKYNNDRVFNNKKSSHLPAIKLSAPLTVLDKQVVPNTVDYSKFVNKNIKESQVYCNDVSKEVGSDKLGFQDDELIDISYLLESEDMGSNGVLSIRDDDQIEQMLAETCSRNLEKSEWNVNGREDEDLSYNLSKTMEVSFDEIECDMEFGFNTWDKEDDMLVWLFENGN